MESDSGISVNLSHFDGGTVRRGGGGGDAVTVAQVINGESEDNLLTFLMLGSA